MEWNDLLHILLIVCPWYSWGASWTRWPAAAG